MSPLSIIFVVRVFRILLFHINVPGPLKVIKKVIDCLIEALRWAIESREVDEENIWVFLQVVLTFFAIWHLADLDQVDATTATVCCFSDHGAFATAGFRDVLLGFKKVPNLFADVLPRLHSVKAVLHQPAFLIKRVESFFFPIFTWAHANLLIW